MLLSWCVVLACFGAVFAAPTKVLVLEKSVGVDVQHQELQQPGVVSHQQPQQPSIVSHQQPVQPQQPQQPTFVSHHNTHKIHTIDPNFRDSQFYQAMDEAGANLFKGLGNAATSLGQFLSRLTGGGH